MLRIIYHFLQFIKNPSDHKLRPLTKNTVSKIFFSLFLFNIAIMVLILPLLYFIDFLAPLINHPDLLFESPVGVIIAIGIFAPLIEEFIFRYFLTYKRFYDNFISRNNWRKRFRWIVYSSTLIFGLIHLENYMNDSWIFYSVALIIVLPQITIGFILAYIRVRLGFRYSIFYHALWNLSILTFGVTGTYLMNPVIEYKKNNIELKVDCTPFRDRYIDKFDIEKQQDTIYNMDIKQYPLQVIVDSIYGKGVYHVNDQYLNIQLKSEAGIHKDEFLKIMDEEFTIIDKVTLK